MSLRNSLLALPALLILAGLAAADDVRVFLLDGKKESGAIASIASNEIVLKTSSGTLALPLSQVLEVQIRDRKGIDPAYKFADVVLTDDTVLHCKDVAFQSDQVQLTLLSGVVLKVPITSVVSFCREANNAALAKRFDEIAQIKVNKDRIVILRDGVLSKLEGTLGEVKKGEQTIQFTTQNNTVPIDVGIDKLHGIIFFRNPAAPPAAPICKVIDVQGNSLTAVKLSHDGRRLTMTTPTGNELVLPEEVLASLDFNLGKQTYLSSLVPSKLVEKSGIGLPHSFSQNANLDGERIFLNKTEYAKGLSMHAFTDVEYNLAGKFKALHGLLGVDTRTGADSEPKVTIYCDDRVVFSEVVTPQKVHPLNLDIRGVRVLRIVVSSKNLLDLHDHVTLADGQVTQ